MTSRSGQASGAGPELTGKQPLSLSHVTVALVSQTQRRRRATAGTDLARVRALAGDPHLFMLAARITEETQREHAVGGR